VRTRVLVVDDQPEFRALLREVLHDAGFEVLEAATGAEGLERVAEGVALAILDVRLPDISGVEVCRRLKADAGPATPLVLMLSAFHASSDDRSLGLESGADAYLRKPVEIRELLATVRALLRLRRAEDALRESQQRYRSLVEGSVQGVCVHRDFVIQFANAAYARIGGVASPEELIGQDCRQFVPPDERVRIEAYAAARLRGEPSPPVYEHRALRRDGTVFWLEVRASVIDWDGEPASLVTVLDITARREAEEQRRRAEDALADRARETALAADIGVALTEGRPLAATLQRCADAIVRHLGAALVRVWTVGADRDVLELVASAGLSAEVDGALSRVPVGTLTIGRIARERRPYVTNALAGDPLADELHWSWRAGLTAFAGYPLVVEDRLVGVIALLARRSLGGAAVTALGSVADTLALGIDRKRADDALQTMRADLAAHLLSASLDLEDVLSRLTDTARAVLGADLIRFWIRDAATNTFPLYSESGGTSGQHARPSATPGAGIAGWVLEHREMLALDDVRDDPRVRNPAWLEAEGLVSLLTMPVVVDGTVAAVVAAGTRVRRRWSDEDLRRARTLGDAAAVAIRNATLFRTSEEQRRTAEAFAAVGRALSETLDVAVVGRKIVESLLALLDVEVARLFRLDRASGALVAVAQAGPPTIDVSTPRLFPAGTGLVGLAVRERGAVASADVLADPRVVLPAAVSAELARTGLGAALAVPLLAHGEVIGAVIVLGRTGRVFRQTEVGLAGAFADHAAVAVHNATTFEEAERRRRAAESLADVGRLVTQSLDLHEVAQRIADSLQTLLEARNAVVLRYDPGRDDLEALATSSGVAGEPAGASGLRVPLGDGVAGFAARARRTMVTADALGDARFTISPEIRARLEANGYRAVVAVPLVVEGRLVGVLSVGADAGRVFDADAVRLAETFAGQAALALENARLYRQTLGRLRQTRALAHVGRLVSATLDAETVRARIVESVRDLLGARAAALFHLSAETGELVPGASTRPPEMRARLPRSIGSAGVMGSVVARGRPVVTADAVADPALALNDEARAWYEATGDRAVLAVPLRAAQRVLGVLAAVDLPGRRWDAEEIALAQAFADQAALALENARLYERQSRQVRELERMAREVFESARVKEAFLLNVSHELGTPLTAIKAYVDTLAADPALDPATRRQFFEILQGEIDRLARLIGNILDVSRLELGRLDFEMGPADLDTIAAAVAAELSLGGRVLYESSGPLPVKGDRDRLTQVLVNLVDNAVKFSREDSPVVVRGARWQEHAVIRILDRGRGIPQGRLERLFQKFERLHERGEGPRGSGLGLYLSSEIVKAHGGTVGVERREGGGSVFWVALPLAEAGP